MCKRSPVRHHLYHRQHCLRAMSPLNAALLAQVPPLLHLEVAATPHVVITYARMWPTYRRCACRRYLCRQATPTIVFSCVLTLCGHRPYPTNSSCGRLVLVRLPPIRPSHALPFPAITENSEVHSRPC
ncbi:hypothetical protein BHE74_00028980 [Ensete ventricosum]|nr:hypothetical protein BHE74_00028980 [Ensete ventricosum]